MSYISASVITLIDENGVDQGRMKTGMAKTYARERGMELVEVPGKLDTYTMKKYEPRKFNRGVSNQYQQEKDSERAQYTITAPTVRLTDENGNSVGVISTAEARQMAADRSLDLIAVNNKIDPPIGKLGDLNKYIYEQKKAIKDRDKKNRAAAKASDEKEIKYTTDTSDSSKNDRMRMLKQANEFMEGGHPVRFTIDFRGRQMAHSADVMDRIREEMEANLTGGKISKVDQAGNRFCVFCAPNKRNK